MGLQDITIKFHPSGKSVQASPGSSLLKAAEAAGITLGVPCGGKGRCGKCKVIFRHGAPLPTPTEQDRLTETELAQGYRLGCQVMVSQDAVVHVPDGAEAGRILTTGVARDIPLNPAIRKVHARVSEPSVDDLRADLRRVLDAFSLPAESRSGVGLEQLRRLGQDIRTAQFAVTGVFARDILVGIEPGDTTSVAYGAAVDIGTTTLAAYLIDLSTGEQVSVAAAMNPQAAVGDDVVSRINHVIQEPDGLEKLRSSVVNEINTLLRTMARSADVDLGHVYEVCVVGNTCMAHLFLGIDPRYLALAPYVPVVAHSLYVPARELGIEISPFGRVHVLPSIAGYVGADTVGVVLATGLNEDDRLTLAVDIGTNGEIVLGSRKRMLACSTAAGPAFEGAHIRHGMRAAPGAIDAVWFDDGSLHYSTLSGVRPVGICGSGLLDAIVCLVQAGIIESGGRIVDSNELPQESAHLADRLRSGERGNEFILAPTEETSIGEPVTITQRDVREVQLAKAAIAAGIQTLMEKMNVTADDLDQIVLAGAFGNYVRKDSAMAVGMIPNVPLSKVRSVGNAAGEGAKLALLSVDLRDKADRIADSIEYIELTTDLGFQERFADALAFG